MRPRECDAAETKRTVSSFVIKRLSGFSPPINRTLPNSAAPEAASAWPPSQQRRNRSALRRTEPAQNPRGQHIRGRTMELRLVGRRRWCRRRSRAGSYGVIGNDRQILQHRQWLGANVSSSLPFSGWRSRSLSLGEGLTELTGAPDGTRADGVLDRGRRRLFSF